jgi:hypothetical protein
MADEGLSLGRIEVELVAREGELMPARMMDHSTDAEGRCGDDHRCPREGSLGSPGPVPG